MLPEDPDRAKSQALLAEFLKVDLDIGFTMLRTADIEAGSDPAHCQAALAKVRNALDTMRMLVVRIEQETSKAIQSRADELESAFVLGPPLPRPNDPSTALLGHYRIGGRPKTTADSSAAGA